MLLSPSLVPGMNLFDGGQWWQDCTVQTTLTRHVDPGRETNTNSARFVFFGPNENAARDQITVVHRSIKLRSASVSGPLAMARFHRDRDLEHFDGSNDITAANRASLSPTKKASKNTPSDEAAALESLRKRMAGRE